VTHTKTPWKIHKDSSGTTSIVAAEPYALGHYTICDNEEYYPMDAP